MTNAVHAGREDLTALGVHVAGIDQSTTYPVTGVTQGGDSYEQMATGGRPRPGDSYVYQRLWNPNVDRFERGLATMEGAEEAVAFSTGMAAISAVLLACVAAGKPHIVGVRPLYGGTDHLLATGLLGTRVTFTTPDAVADAIEADTGLVLIESPGNPTIDLIDIADVARQAGDVPVAVDNTFATPVLQQPLALGAAISLHSATKYIGGHGDLLGGVVATSTEWATRLRQVRAITGGLLAPTSAYQLHRGLQTLPVRVLQQQANARPVAAFLAEHDLVEWVRYPGLPAGDPDDIAARQMAGPGAMMAFAVKGGFDAAAAVAEHVRLVVNAVSLGGVDTLIQHPAALTHRPVASEAKPGEDVLRLSIGLENPDDVIADLRQALEAARDLSPEPAREEPNLRVAVRA